MPRLLQILLCVCICLISSKCKIHDAQSKLDASKEVLSELDLKLARANLEYDTSSIVIFDDSTKLSGTGYGFYYRKGKQPYLTQQDLLIIDSLFKKSVLDYNARMKERISLLLKDSAIERTVYESSFFNYVAKDVADPKEQADYFYLNQADYKRQYVPYFNDQGELEVFVRALCCSRSFDFDPDHWKKYLDETKDGGKYYFKIWIKPKHKTCSNLIIGGE